MGKYGKGKERLKKPERAKPTGDGFGRVLVFLTVVTVLSEMWERTQCLQSRGSFLRCIGWQEYSEGRAGREILETRCAVLHERVKQPCVRFNGPALKASL